MNQDRFGLGVDDHDRALPSLGDEGSDDGAERLELMAEGRMVVTVAKLDPVGPARWG